MTTANPQCTEKDLATPTAVTSNGNQLFVASLTTNRVLLYEER